MNSCKCGGEARLIYSQAEGENYSIAQVVCTKCESSSDCYIVGGGNEYEAVAQWDRENGHE